MNTQVLIVGCGDLGTELARRLKQHGLTPIGVRRSKAKDAGFPCLQADVTNPSSLAALQNINSEFLVYCVAASAQTDENYLQHYVDGLRYVLEALHGASNLKHVFFVSSTRVYGQISEAVLDEAVPASPSDFGGQRLLEAETLLANAHQAWTYTSLRLTGIYGPGRTRMLNLAASPSQWPQQNNWTNRIHRDDAAAFIQHLIQMKLRQQPLQDCYVVTDSCPAPQHEVLHWIAKHMGKHVAAQMPPVAGGKRMSNQRMLATGFELRYPDYKTGYADLLQSV